MTLRYPETSEAAADTAIILLTFNQREVTLRCLESLSSVASPPHRTILWDNGSKDGTAAAVASAFPDVVVHQHETNLGVASGRNAAARLAIESLSPRFLLFLDNDMEVRPEFLDLIRRPLLEADRIAVTTAKIACLGEPKRLYGAGGCYVNFVLGKTGHVGHGEIDRGQYDEGRECLASGGCIFARTSVFSQLGGFDSGYDPYGPEDLDFSLRVREAGFSCIYVPQAIVFHEAAPGHTGGGGMHSRTYVSNKTRNWFRFMKRHARLDQQLLFLLFGGPFGLLRLLVREGRKGNTGAVRELFRGLAQHLRRNDDLPTKRK